MWEKFSGFYRLPVYQRVEKLREELHLDRADLNLLRGFPGLPVELADRMVENVVGVYGQPLGVALYFRVNGRDHVVPMAVEESSVVAAASKAAKIALASGGFQAVAPRPVTIGQVQVVECPDVEAASAKVREKQAKLLAVANDCQPLLVELGGGAFSLRTRRVDGRRGTSLLVELLVDVRDAMGANTVNTMLETVAPEIEALTGGRVVLRILSNLAVERVATARATFAKHLVGGEQAVENFLWAVDLAEHDPFRAATHNKGIMNGIVAVAQATGNDTRALEAGAHAFAAHGRAYHPLTSYDVDGDGNLVGRIELPLTVGTVGGITGIHPQARLALKVLGVKSSAELCEVLASVGLAQNFAALLALSTEGIQRGHMKLHAANLALAAGAPREVVDDVVRLMVKRGETTLEGARRALNDLLGGGGGVGP
ncbi:MAG: hydroxymethylglutaryl-CoA reductase, degradative [Promethearchaeota archaeon]